MQHKHLKILLEQYDTILDQITKRLKIERTEEDVRLYEHYHHRYQQTKNQYEKQRRIDEQDIS